MNNSNQVRHFVLNGSVQTSGGTSELSDGSFALVDRGKKQDGSGLVAIDASDLQTIPKNKERLILTVGELKHANTRSRQPKNSHSVPFAVEDVLEIVAFPPKQASPQVDEWVIGYNGHNPNTSFEFKQGMSPLRIDLKLQGGSLPYSAVGSYEQKLNFVYDFNEYDSYLGCSAAANCDDIGCKKITDAIVEQMKRTTVGGRKLGDILEISTVSDCNEGLGSDAFTTWTLSVCDLGDNAALSQVQNSLKGMKVTRVERRGSISVYQVLVAGDNSSGNAPDDFTPTLAGVLADCGLCANGSATDSGFVYQFIVEDDGTDKSTTIDGAVSNISTERIGEDYGKGSYITTSETKLDDSDITAILTALGLPTTFDYIGELTSICEGTDGDPVSWVAGETCYGSSETYNITLADTRCGNDRLAELQEAYPDYNVTFSNENPSTFSIDLTGATAGTLKVTIDGVDYSQAFSTDEATTAAAFVTANGSALTTAGFTVTSNGAVITIDGGYGSLSGATITPLTGQTDTTGTVSPSSVGCQNTYQATVPTNIVCEECDDAFINSYSSEKPEAFEDNEWKLNSTSSTSTGCKCGIRIKSKLYKNMPPVSELYDLPYVEDSVEVHIAAAGFATQGRLSGVRNWDKDVAKTRLSKKANRDHVAGNLICNENESYIYFQDTNLSKDYLRRQWLGHASRFTELDSQYINYAVKVRRHTQSNYMNQHTVKDITYNFYTQVGLHKDFEKILNGIASAAGIEGVKVTA